MWDEAQLFVIVGSVVCRLWMAAFPATGIIVFPSELESCGASFLFLPLFLFFPLILFISPSPFLSLYIAMLLIENSASGGCKQGSMGIEGTVGV